MSLSALPGHGWTADEEESFLRDTEEVAQSFVSLVLGQERGVEKSPASGKLAADGAHTAAPSRATQVRGEKERDKDNNTLSVML